MSAYRLTDTIKLMTDASAAGTVDPDYTGTPFIDNVPCKIIPRNGQEKYRGIQLEATTNHIIELRYYDGLLPTMIAVNKIDSTEYLIKFIHNIQGMNREIVIEATEVTA